MNSNATLTLFLKDKTDLRQILCFHLSKPILQILLSFPNTKSRFPELRVFWRIGSEFLDQEYMGH